MRVAAKLALPYSAGIMSASTPAIAGWSLASARAAEPENFETPISISTISWF